MSDARRAAAADHSYRGGYLVGLLLLGVVAVRAVLFYQGQARLATLLLAAAFGGLYLAEPRLAAHRRRLRWIYFPVQTALLLAASSLRPFLDVTTLLYLPLAMQASRAFTRRATGAWVTLFIVLLSAALVRDMGWLPGLALALTIVAGGAFLIGYDLLYGQAQADQAESQTLLAELQTAHEKLQAYIAQAEELATVRERNRLARELHDSVSQAMFSVTLTAQAARQLLDQDPARAAELVDRLGEVTADALAQLRSLIAQLRPPAGAPSVSSPTTPDISPPSQA